MHTGRPTLSVAVVVRHEQAWVEELLESVLGQQFGDLEIVAIDDASPTHAPALLDAAAARDARVRVDHLPEAIGFAAARERALAAATGQYVWFVRPTDLVHPEALPVIGERLRLTDPDVLLVHHVQRTILGAETEGPLPKVLARIAKEAEGGGARWDSAARFGAQPQNKLFRRSLLEEVSPHVAGEGGRADPTLTWPALLAARKIDAVPSVCYVRRSPPNATRGGGDASPSDVFEEHDRVFAFADRRPDLPADRRAALVRATLRQELRLLASLPQGERRAFFRQMSEAYRRHAGSTATAPVGRLRTASIAHGSYLGFRALERAAALRAGAKRRRVALGKRRRRMLKNARERRLARYYRSRLRQPIDPNLAIFGAYYYRSYSCNPRAIYEKARELVPGMRGVWVVRPGKEASMPPGVEYVVLRTREYYDLTARASYFVNNVNFPNELVKREGTTHVMTHHGVPLKVMGIDMQRGVGTKMDFGGMLRRTARWDYAVSPNAHQTVIFERVFPGRYETLEVGYPRNDELVNAGPEDVRRIRESLGIRDGQTAVLYTPTHRDHETKYTPLIDVEAVADALGPDYVLLARAHHFYVDPAKQPATERRGSVLDVSAHPSTEELCLAADVLVTDYSSIMFDYALLDRPIVIHAADWDVYRTVRGVYFDITTDGPGVVTRSDHELVEAFRSRAVWGEQATQARAAFRARFCTVDDGHAAERVVQRVWADALAHTGAPDRGAQVHATAPAPSPSDAAAVRTGTAAR